MHKVFDMKRVNLVNSRKEFFSVSLDEIVDEVGKISSNVEFNLTAEAKDYIQSKAIRAQQEDLKSIGDIRNKFPEKI